MAIADVLDTVMDRSLVLGYTRIGPEVRKNWWPADPRPGSMSDRRVLVTGATSGIGKAAAAGWARLGAETYVMGHNKEHRDEARAGCTPLRCATTTRSTARLGGHPRG
jgi:hypothetical protein